MLKHKNILMYTFRTRCECLDGQIEKEHFERKIGWTCEKRRFRTKELVEKDVTA